MSLCCRVPGGRGESSLGFSKSVLGLILCLKVLHNWRWFRSLFFFLRDKLCASNIGLKFDMQIQHALDTFALYSYLLKYYREKWWEQSSRMVNSFVWIVCGTRWLGEQLGLLISLMVPTVGFVWVFPWQAVPSELSPPPLDSVQGIRIINGSQWCDSAKKLLFANMLVCCPTSKTI